MCGIAGFLGPHASTSDAGPILARMTAALAHRGPDDEGAWIDPAAAVALGNRRLAVRDLSPGGHQPMACACGRHVLTYNGEIYNAAAIAAELSDRVAFRGHSDTEVAVEAICAWGIEAALGRFDGMFAFADWDRHGRALHLARDHAGIKPLFYGRAGDALLFASELKALRAHPAFAGRIDRDALALFLRLAYVPPPLSIHEAILKLPPGTWVSIVPDRGLDPPAPRPYWSLDAVAAAGASHPLHLSDEEAVDRLEALLLRTVRDQLVADVPVGAFLSGGIDSSVVAALMQAVAEKPVHTFSIGFRDSPHDEAPFARAVAAHIGARHTGIYVTPDEAREVIPRLPEIYDEPFAEPSQIPISILAAHARRHVTVVLTGDGGDELFGGYAWYRQLAGRWQANRRLPVRLRRLGARALRAATARPESSFARALAHVPGRLGDVLETRPHKLLAVLEAERPEELYRALRSGWADADALVLGERPAAHRPPEEPWGLAGLDDVRLPAMLLDMRTFLPEHPLAKVDRATMAVGLEARVPLLAREVIELAWRLPIDQRVRGRTPKWILRRVLARHVPPRLTERPKVGFLVPMGAWLRGPLRDWAEELLAPDRLRREGILDPRPIERAWREHRTGRRDWERPLWSVLVFQAWLAGQSGAPGAAAPPPAAVAARSRAPLS